MLGRWGYEVVPAGTGEEAWARLEGPEAPRLTVLAWRMEKGDGVDVCRRLRLRPEAPESYVLLTLEVGDEDLLDGLNAGADDFLFKPFQPMELKARVRTGARVVEVEQALRASQDALRVQTTRDALTGSWNHAAIMDLLMRERDRARRKSGSVGVVLADVDELRKVNDSLGHTVGDEILRETARRVSSSVRPYDAVGRYGGEEFLIVLPGSDGLGALTVAERIRESFARRPVHTSAGPVPVTLSLGVAAEGGEAGIDAEGLIRAADSALARAKKGGRNRAALADDSGVAIDLVPPPEEQPGQ